MCVSQGPGGAGEPLPLAALVQVLAVAAARRQVVPLPPPVHVLAAAEGLLHRRRCPSLSRRRARDAARPAAPPRQPPRPAPPALPNSRRCLAPATASSTAAPPPSAEPGRHWPPAPQAPPARGGVRVAVVAGCVRGHAPPAPGPRPST